MMEPMQEALREIESEAGDDTSERSKVLARFHLVTEEAFVDAADRQQLVIPRFADPSLKINVVRIVAVPETSSSLLE